MARSVIVSAVRTPFGKLGGALKDYEAPKLGAHVIRAALEQGGPRAERDRVRDHGRGAPGRRRPGARAAGGDRRRAAEGAPRGHDQQGVRLVDPRGADRRRDDPLGRPPRGRHRRDGVDVERAVPAEEGALRLQARQRRADRPHGLRRADVQLRQQAHGRAGVVRLARARDLPRGPGRVGAALARARGRRAGRRALRRRDRRRRRLRGRRRAPARHVARAAVRARSRCSTPRARRPPATRPA